MTYIDRIWNSAFSGCYEGAAVVLFGSGETSFTSMDVKYEAK